MDKSGPKDQYLQSGGTESGPRTARSPTSSRDIPLRTFAPLVIFLPRTLVPARPAFVAGVLAAALLTAASAQAQDPLPELEVVDRDSVITSTASRTQLRDWQVGYFRRGGSAVVVTAFDISRDSVFWQFLGTWGVKKDGAVAGLGWSGEMSAVSRPSPTDSITRGASATIAGKPRAKWAASLEAPWDSLAIRMRVEAPPDPDAMSRVVQGGVTGQTRIVVGPPPQPEQAVTLSDILLYEPDERKPPTGLEGANGAMARALGTTALSGRRQMGLYWEMYNLPVGELAEASLTVTRLLSHGEARTVLVSDDPDTRDAKTIARVTWELHPSKNDNGITTQGIVLDVGSLGIGRYAAVVTVAVPGQEPVIVVREFRVEVPATR